MGDGTELGRVRGLGPAHEGEEGWMQQRMTAVGNLLLVGFLAFSLVLLPDLSYGSVAGWLKHPLPTVAMALLVVNVFWHARLGLSELIGDYVHDAGNKFAALLLVRFATIAGTAFGLYFIARIAFGGAPA
ncbi:MAG TPA: succinate dehydrogenase, hydrophobic membrane anchor protein [Croceibacterium sp.]|nr:succinate dehydrogenase, hydrophobic membrane anchor protein [Croceibacterium sp.]